MQMGTEDLENGVCAPVPSSSFNAPPQDTVSALVKSLACLTQQRHCLVIQSTEQHAGHAQARLKQVRKQCLRANAGRDKKFDQLA